MYNIDNRVRLLRLHYSRTNFLQTFFVLLVCLFSNGIFWFCSLKYMQDNSVIVHIHCWIGLKIQTKHTCLKFKKTYMHLDNMGF